MGKGGPSSTERADPWSEPGKMQGDDYVHGYATSPNSLLKRTEHKTPTKAMKGKGTVVRKGRK